MKKIFVFALSCLCLVGMTGKVHAFSTAGTCKVQGSTVFLTWIEQDASSLSHVWVAIGDVTANPNTWTSQEISIDSEGAGNITPPMLYLNSENSALVVWEYYDTTAGKSFVGAAVYDSGTTTWTSQKISDNTTENCIFNDEIGSFDDDGNMVVTWTGYNESTDDAVVRCATGLDASGTITWNNSFTVPAPAPFAKAGKNPVVHYKVPIKTSPAVVKKPAVPAAKHVARHGHHKK